MSQSTLFFVIISGLISTRINCIEPNSWAAHNDVRSYGDTLRGRTFGNENDFDSDYGTSSYGRQNSGSTGSLGSSYVARPDTNFQAYTQQRTDSSSRTSGTSLGTSRASYSPGTSSGDFQNYAVQSPVSVGRSGIKSTVGVVSSGFGVGSGQSLYKSGFSETSVGQSSQRNGYGSDSTGFRGSKGSHGTSGGTIYGGGDRTTGGFAGGSTSGSYDGGSTSGGYGGDSRGKDHNEGDEHHDSGKWLEVYGTPGTDFPIYNSVPNTGFSCGQQQYPGYYADPESQCQAFYICQAGGRQDGFLCPNATLFNQAVFVCDWWYNVDCSQATSLYNLNADLYRETGSSYDDGSSGSSSGGGRYDGRGESRGSGGYSDQGTSDGYGGQRTSDGYGGQRTSDGYGGQKAGGGIIRGSGSYGGQTSVGVSYAKRSGMRRTGLGTTSGGRTSSFGGSRGENKSIPPSPVKNLQQQRTIRY